MASEKVGAHEDFARLVAARVRHALPGQGTAPLHEPVFRGREWDNVKHCLDEGWVSSAGSHVDAFERAIAERVGVRHAIATVNGTAALHLGLLVLGVEANDEVLVPGLSFVATANAVAHCHAVPHFVDASEADFGIDADKLEKYLARIVQRDGACTVNRQTGRRIGALVVTHVMGYPANIEPLSALAERWGLPLVEDAAEALGSLTGGRHVGSFGALAALSFNGNKIVTTGGGGALLTNDDRLAQQARHLGTTAKQPHRWRYDHDAVAWNYRLPNINAALGLAQLEQLNGFLAAKRGLMVRYMSAFEGFNGAHLLRERPGDVWNHWLVTLLLDVDDADHGQARDSVLAALHEIGVLARPAWTPLHLLPMFADAPRADMSTTERLARRIINLPSGVGLA